MQTVGDLEHFWKHVNTRVDRPILQSLARLVRTSPPSDYVVIPAGVDHAALLDYPLSNRARNGFGSAGFFVGHDAITVGMLLNARRIGRVSVIELMCVSEVAQGHRQGRSASDESPGPPTSARLAHPPAWDIAIGAFTPLFAAAHEFCGVKTIGGALQQNLWHLAHILGAAEALESLPIESLTGAPHMAKTVVGRLERTIESMPSSWLRIIESRLLSPDPPALRAVGRELGVTGERVRQIEVKAKKQIHRAVGREISIISTILGGQLPPVTRSGAIEHITSSVFDPDLTGSLPTKLARRMLAMELDYSRDGDHCFNREARKAARTLAKMGREAADDAGLVDEPTIRAQLESHRCEPFFDALIRRAGLHRIGSHITLRVTDRARIKAAVLDIGRPATKEEIAQAASMNTARVTARLSTVSSVVRADKTRWALAEWVDDVYEGIPAEIVQRIEEDGGSVAMARLLEELPRMFGVSEGSVRSYARTRQFTLEGGYVRITDDPLRELRPLEAVIHGRDAVGHPFWVFTVENQFFEGFNLTRIPPEVAYAIGCEPNARTEAHVDHPTDCRNVTVNWRLASTTGADIGRISGPLRRLGVGVSDSVRLVIKGRGHVEMRRHEDSPNRGGAKTAEALLAKLKDRHRVL